MSVAIERRQRATGSDSTPATPRWSTFGVMAQLAVLLSVLSSPNCLRGQAASDWVGKKVVQKRPTFQLKTESRLINTGARLLTYRVERVNGPWLWLTAKELSGWAEAAEMIAVEQSIEFFTDYIRSNPSQTFGYMMRAKLWQEEKNQFDSALADYTEAIRLQSKNAYLYKNRGSVWMEKRDYDNAIADFTEAIRIDPDYASAYSKRAIAWHAKQKFDNAITDYTEAIRKAPTNAYVYRNRGDAWSALKDFDRALSDCNEAIRLNPTFATAYDSRGAIRAERREFDDAIADFHEAIRLDPNHASAFNNRGSVWSQKKDFDRAFADFGEAIRINPKFAPAYHNRGHAWSDKKDYDRAIADYSKAIEIDPNYASAYVSRGYAWSAKGDYEKAIADYNATVNIDPKDAEGYNARAWLMATCSDPKYRDGKRAVESGIMACKLTEWKEANYIDTLAAAHAEAGDFDEAVKWQTKAIDLYADRGDKEKGDERLKRYRERKPYREPTPTVSTRG